MVRDHRQFANVASHVRINATNHPTWRATQTSFRLPRLELFRRTERDEDEFFEWRRSNSISFRPRSVDRPWRGDPAG